MIDGAGDAGFLVANGDVDARQDPALIVFDRATQIEGADLRGRWWIVRRSARTKAATKDPEPPVTANDAPAPMCKTC